MSYKQLQEQMLLEWFRATAQTRIKYLNMQLQVGIYGKEATDADRRI